MNKIIEKYKGMFKSDWDFIIKGLTLIDLQLNTRRTYKNEIELLKKLCELVEESGDPELWIEEYKELKEELERLENENKYN